MDEFAMQSATYTHPALMPSAALQRELKRIQSLSGFWVHYDTPFTKFIVPDDFLYPLTPSDQDYILELDDADPDVSVVMDGNAVYVVAKYPERYQRMKLVAVKVSVRLQEMFGSFRKIGSDIYAVS